MTNDPNKKTDQPGQQHGQEPGQQHNNPEKRPPQGGHDVERDEENKRDQGQRRAS